ncbi:MAG: hypothetical protein Tsb0014_16090 [Pleurocapsa sp.]
MLVNPLNGLEKNPTIAKQLVCVEDNLTLHYRHDLPGELEAPQGFTHHLITFFLTENQRQITNFDSYGEYEGKMTPGEFYLCPAKVSSFTSWKVSDKTLHLILNPNFLEQVARETECLNSEKVELLPILKSQDSQIEQIVRLLFQEMQSNSFGQKLLLESLSDVLAVHLLRNYGVFKPVFRQYTDGLGSYRLHQTIDYIQTNLDRNLSLELMAKQIGLSRYYFATQFKQAMGISPYQYINQQRIEKAKKLLKQQDRAIADIAFECGFSSQSHFSKVFRQYVSTTPKRYREQLH